MKIEHNVSVDDRANSQIKNRQPSPAAVDALSAMGKKRAFTFKQIHYDVSRRSDMRLVCMWKCRQRAGTKRWINKLNLTNRKPTEWTKRIDWLFIIIFDIEWKMTFTNRFYLSQCGRRHSAISIYWRVPVRAYAALHLLSEHTLHNAMETIEFRFHNNKKKKISNQTKSNTASTCSGTFSIPIFLHYFYYCFETPNEWTLCIHFHTFHPPFKTLYNNHNAQQFFKTQITPNGNTTATQVVTHRLHFKIENLIYVWQFFFLLWFQYTLRITGGLRVHKICVFLLHLPKLKR